MKLFSMLTTSHRLKKNNLDSLVKRQKYLKEFIQQMRHSEQDITEEDQCLTKHLDTARKNIFRDNAYIYRFYFVPTEVVIIVTFVLVFFIANHVRLKTLFTELALN